MPQSAGGRAKRREMLRDVLGRPGSFPRWMLFTGTWLLVCLVVFIQVGWVLRIFVILVAGIIPFSAFRARSLLLGDEDEVGAEVRRQMAEGRGPEPIPGEDARLAPEHWLSRSGKYFDGVPLPPSAEDDDAPQESSWR